MVSGGTISRLLLEAMEMGDKKDNTRETQSVTRDKFLKAIGFSKEGNVRSLEL